MVVALRPPSEAGLERARGYPYRFCSVCHGLNNAGLAVALLGAGGSVSSVPDNYLQVGGVSPNGRKFASPETYG